MKKRRANRITIYPCTVDKKSFPIKPKVYFGFLHVRQGMHTVLDAVNSLHHRTCNCNCTFFSIRAYTVRSACTCALNCFGTN